MSETADMSAPNLTTTPTVLLVPGLREHVDAHWQTLLLAQRPAYRGVPPMGREDLDCARRVDAIERAAQAIIGPLVIVAHSAGCIMVAHWAQQTRRVVLGALMATPPDFESPMPVGYPTIEQLDRGGWLPVPRAPLPFHSIVALSRNDPLGAPQRVAKLAADWGSEVADLGEVGHLNPASGYGAWPAVVEFITRLSSTPVAH